MRINPATWLLSALMIACGGSDTDPSDTQQADVETPDDLVNMEFAVCIPGTFKECSDDNLGQVTCNADGSGYEVVACGDDSICLSDNVGCTACKPGNKKCQDDDIVLRCDETGSEYVQGQDCNGAETGQICLLGSCVKLCEINQKLHSYIGCEYWGADLDNAFVPGGRSGFYDAAGSQYSIVVSNTSPKYPAKVEIFTNEGPQLTDSNGNPWPAEAIEPMGLRIFNLPRRDVNSTVLAPLAYKVTSSIPITAYQFNPLENVDVFSNDASILLPSHVLGKYYIVMTREQTFQELKGYLTVIATFPGETQVTVTVTAPTLADNGIEHLEPGDSLVLVLEQFDVLNLETDAYGADLTGSIVLANHPVAVFGGSEAANAPNTNHCCPDGDCGDDLYEQPWLECKDKEIDCFCDWPYENLIPRQEVPCDGNDDCIKYNTCCADHLEMQMYPVKTWGTEYIATHSYPRGKEKDVWRIMAAENGTQVTTYPTQVNAPVLNRGEYVDFDSPDHFEIHAKKPVLVGQFLAAQDAPDPNVGGIKGKDDAATGDPAFILAVAEEQFRNEYVFLSPDKYMFDCVNLIVPVGAVVHLDGEEVIAEDLTFRPIREIQTELKDKGLSQPSDLGIQFGDYSLIGTGKWGVYRLVVSDGVHTAVSDQPFGVIAYGYDQYVSYGYPAGLNLEDLKLVTEVP